MSHDDKLKQGVLEELKWEPSVLAELLRLFGIGLHLNLRVSALQ
jgi:hypothetical protein